MTFKINALRREERKMSLQKKVLVSFVALVIGVSVAACGNNSNNDQGTSFLALGYFCLLYTSDAADE